MESFGQQDSHLAFSAGNPMKPSAGRNPMKKMIVFLLTLVVLGVFATDAFVYANGSHPSQDSPTVTVTFLRR
jgi:hypothetical protein